VVGALGTTQKKPGEPGQQRA